MRTDDGRRIGEGRRFRIRLVALLPLLIAPACHGNAGTSGGTASDDWTRSLTLSDHGVVEIGAKDGSIEVEGTTGSTVEIRAERTVHAATERAARDLLSRITMEEHADTGRVSVTTEGIPGILLGVSVKVAFHVQMPSSAQIRARLANGDVAVRGVTGGSSVSTTNGRINGAGLGSAIDARVVNGRVAIDVGALGAEPVALSTTNGAIDLALPRDANATLIASTINGQVRLPDLPFIPQNPAEADGRRPRAVSGKINAGGTTIDLKAVNGSITVHAR